MFGKSINIGLDIGQSSVKIAILSYDKNKILKLATIPTMKKRQHIEDLPDSKIIGNKIKESLGNFLDSNPSIVMAIQGEGTICKYEEIPKLTEKELEIAVPSIAQKYIPFPLKDVVLTHVTVPPISLDNSKSAIFFIAAHKNLIENQKKLMGCCRFRIERLELQAFALLREFTKNHGVDSNNFKCIINVGSRLTQLIIFRDIYPYYVRDFSIAGDDFTYAFQMGNQSSWETAESYKYNYKVSNKEIHIEPIILKWMSEIKKSLDYFKNQLLIDGLNIKKIFLSGGTSRMQGLDKRVSKFLNSPVESDYWDKIKKFDKKDINNSCIYKVAVGLAL